MAASKSAQNNVNELEAFFARQELATAEAWRPEPGETIIGTVAGFRRGIPSDPQLKEYPIIVVRTEFGVRALHAFHTMLQEGFQEIGVKVGMRVACTYQGPRIKNDAKDKAEKDLEKTDTYHMYFVADLDAIAAAPEDEGGFFTTNK